MGRTTYYELSEQQVAELDQKMRELLELCQINRVPCFVSCAVSNTPEETMYKNIIYSAQSHDMELTDDRIRKHMLIATGEFDAVPKRETITFSPFGIAEGEKNE